MKKWLLLLLLLNAGLAQNNAAVEFSIFIDREPPVSDSFNYTPVINSVSDSFTASAFWTDDYLVKGFVFEWNLSGVFVNDSLTPLTNDWSNVSKVFSPTDEGKLVDFTINAVDYSGNWNNTGFNSFIISLEAPSYSNVSQSDDSPLIGDVISISSYWSDNFLVDSVQLQTNESGSWINNGSPVVVNAVSGWANFTIDTSGMNSSPYYWRLIGYDAVSNANETPAYFFTPQ